MQAKWLSERVVSTVSVTAVTIAALAVLFASFGARAQAADHRNTTAGGKLRPGVYGRIEVRGAPPAVIYSEPMVVSELVAPAGTQPVYLYVPPGQVRKWKQHCGRWSACDQPVLFVRMDDSPSRWGQWRQYREQVAWQERARD
jgi:hypothetical protein